MPFCHPVLPPRWPGFEQVDDRRRLGFITEPPTPAEVDRARDASFVRSAVRAASNDSISFRQLVDASFDRFAYLLQRWHGPAILTTLRCIQPTRSPPSPASMRVPNPLALAVIVL